MKESLKDCTVVIRGVGERTTSVCHAILQDMFEKNQIFIINEQPFHKAIQRSYEIAREQNKKWLFEVDADILLSKPGVYELFKKAECLPQNFFFHYGLIWDKLSATFRPAGNKLLRTAHIDKALQYLPEAVGQLRPDTFIRKKMAQQGYHYYRDVILMGIHDYEQSYAHLYAKGFLHGVKNKHKIGKFISHWPSKWHLDTDYVVIMAGMGDGMNYQGELSVSADFFEEKFEGWKQINQFAKQKPQLKGTLEEANIILSQHLTDKKQKTFKKIIQRRKYFYLNRSDRKKKHSVFIFWNKVKRKIALFFIQKLNKSFAS